MEAKFLLKIAVILIVLLMVVSCVTPCIAVVENSTNNISNADVSLEGASYIIVHALNPEGIEIASIEGMNPLLKEG